jgi:hypothetical protein
MLGQPHVQIFRMAGKIATVCAPQHVGPEGHSASLPDRFDSVEPRFSTSLETNGAEERAAQIPIVSSEVEKRA